MTKVTNRRTESLTAFIVLSTLSFGLYLWYWGWRAWALERGLRQRRLNATLRSALLGFTLFSLVISLNKRMHRSATRDLIFSGLYFGVSVIGAAALEPLDYGDNLLAILASSLLGGLLCALVLLPVRRTVLDSWRQHETEITKLPGLSRNTKLIVALVICEAVVVIGWLPLLFPQ